MDISKQFKKALNVSTPLIAVRTPDQSATMFRFIDNLNGEGKGRPLVRWDMINGLVGLNAPGKQAVIEAIKKLSPEGGDPRMLTSNATDSLVYASELPGKTIVFWFNAHLPLQSNSSESARQGVFNLRDLFKQNARSLVMLCPGIQLPDELRSDVVILDEPLPNRDELIEITRATVGSSPVEIKMPKDGIERAADRLSGLSSFLAEQVVAMSLTKQGLDMELLSKQHYATIEQTPGLSVYRGKERFDDLGGLKNIKEFFTRYIGGAEPPRAIVFEDEIEKAVAGSGGDTSGVSQALLGYKLSWMQDKGVVGMILIGPGGCQPSGSQVLMADGSWKEVQDIREGDAVVSPQRDGSSEVATVLKTFQFENRELFRITAASSPNSIPHQYLCSKEHVLPILINKGYKKDGKRWNQTECHELTVGCVAEKQAASSDWKKNTRVFTCPAFDLPEKALPIHPYVVGALLGNGCLTGGNPRICDGKLAVMAEVESLVSTSGRKWNESKHAYDVRIVGEDADQIRRSELWGKRAYEKRVPAEYKVGSLAQRLELLAGLIDTDGSARGASDGEYSSTSFQLAKDFSDLAHSVGGWSNMIPRQTTYDGKPYQSFRVSYSFMEHIPPCRTKKKPSPRPSGFKSARNRRVIIEPAGTGTVYGFALSSESSWYVTDGWLVTHNSGKSAISKAVGNEAGIPTIQFDLSGLKSSFVGSSETNMRSALKVIDAVGQGRVLCIATCNSIGVLPPELRRRYTLGTWFVDLPDYEERQAIWALYLKKYKLSVNPLTDMPDDSQWTGAEIRTCCDLAYRLSCSLKDAAAYIVPVAVSAGDKIRELRMAADGKYTSASHPGLYKIPTSAAVADGLIGAGGRRISVED